MLCGRHLGPWSNGRRLHISPEALSSASPLSRAGRLIGDIDLFIAGVAVRHGLTVVAHNTEHFARIPELLLEDWLESPQVSA